MVVARVCWGVAALVCASIPVAKRKVKATRVEAVNCMVKMWGWLSGLKFENRGGLWWKSWLKWLMELVDDERLELDRCWFIYSLEIAYCSGSAFAFLLVYTEHQDTVFSASHTQPRAYNAPFLRRIVRTDSKVIR